MPQLDVVTYFSQVFWVLFVFLFFYTVVLKQLLPLIARVVKVRFKKTDINRISVDIYKNEIFGTQKSFDNLVINSWNVFSLFSISSNVISKNWVYENSFVLNECYSLKAANISFLKSVGNSKIRQINSEKI